MPAPPRSKQKPVQQSIQPFDFESLRNNYLNMLAQKPDNPVPAKDTMNNKELEALQSVADTLLASPEFQDVNSFLTSPFEASCHDFGTSPLIDTPYESFGTSPLLDTPLLDEFNTSPIDDSPFISDLNTPVLQDGDLDMYLFQGMPLIADVGAGMYESVLAPAPPVEKAPVTGSLDMDNLLKLSPQTPAVDSVYPSPAMTANDAFPAPPPPQTRASSTKASTRKPTGTRRNITPAALVPIDAPTQARRYVTPSATSRKEVPAVFARKRNREQAQLDDDGEPDELEPLPPNATEKQQIEWKRRQNTLAARKSRKRKLEYQQGLEAEIAELRMDKEKWKTRAEVLRGMLSKQGVVMDSWPEEA